MKPSVTRTLKKQRGPNCTSPVRHSRESGKPGSILGFFAWAPAFAGVTNMVVLGLMLIATACKADLPAAAKFRSEQKADVAADVDAAIAVEDAGDSTAVVADAIAEIGPDAIADVGPDATVDAAPDVLADLGPELGADVLPDVAIDVLPDAAPDLGPDLVADVPLDVAVDAAPDVAPDVSPDVPAPVDVVADVVVDLCANKTCNDNNVCTTDSCVAATGACQFDGVPQNGKPCDDGSICTTGEKCSAGVCQGGTVGSCDDFKVCTDDSCDPATGCKHVNLGSGTACGGGGTCDGAGSCSGGAVPAGMVLIPAGTFWMGCNSAKDSVCSSKPEENPQHKVTLSAFYMDVTETTVAQYKACVDAGKCTAPGSQVPTKYATFPDLTDHPVNFVSWSQAQQFCQWRGPGIDLPTEAQWEMAARGSCEKNGSTAGDPACAQAMRTYPWGEATPDCTLAVMNTGTGGCATTSGCGCDTSSLWAVASKPAGDSPYGIHDMAGNAWEWSRDAWVAAYAASDQTDPMGLASGSIRPVRGWGFTGTPTLMRASYRGSYAASTQQGGFGLRCARPVDLCAGVACPTLPCGTQACDPATGKCVAALFADNTACDDDNACISAGACKAGICQGGVVANCDDGNLCTTDSCSAVNGCGHAANTLPCEADGSLCTQKDTCSGKICVAGPATACDDGNPCTADSCVAATGKCQFTAAPCTCVPGTKLGCSGSDSFTNGGVGSTTSIDSYVCGAKPILNETGAEHTYAFTPECDGQTTVTLTKTSTTAGYLDLLILDGTQACLGASCLTYGLMTNGGVATVTFDGNKGQPYNIVVDGYQGYAGAFTIKTNCVCGAGNACAGIANGTACNDGNACTTGDSCQIGLCQGATATNCDDGNACTMDVCDASKGCQHTSMPETSPCGGGKACNSAGVCVAGFPGMVPIPAGTFWMGCNPAKVGNCNAQKSPQHKVTLSPYYVDVTETTVAQYAQCVAVGGCSAPYTGSVDTSATQCAGSYAGSNNWSASGPKADRQAHPANCVTRAQAQQYCKWRGAGYDLPTSAQWEMAARGSCEKNGSTAADPNCKAAMRTYPWGETTPDCMFAVTSPGAGQSGCGTGTTWAVGSKTAGDSPFGLHDVAGNVWEFTRDSYQAYTAADQTDPSVYYAGNILVRGGSFIQADEAAADFNIFGLDTALSQLGFRCARSYP